MAHHPTASSSQPAPPIPALDGSSNPQQHQQHQQHAGTKAPKEKKGQGKPAASEVSPFPLEVRVLFLFLF